MKIEREQYTVSFSEPTLYVDNESRKRSGHMTHAMAEFAPGKLIDFNSNCSAVIHAGHSTYGWVEYRISEDGGESFSEIRELPYSKAALYDGLHVISVEKAVACDDGRIVAICLRNDAHAMCPPWDTPMTVTSHDGGESWTEPRELCSYKGRVYDACYYGGVIYALEFCNDATEDFCGVNEEHVYRVFTSHNNGESFEELCVVPIPSHRRAYGSLLIDDQGNMHVYAYNISDEQHMDHIISRDLGRTWEESTVCYLNEGIRNPQTAQLNGVYILHGRRAGGRGFVFYTSLDGQSFDEASFLGRARGGCYYSNNIILKDRNGNDRMLVQYSETYSLEHGQHCVNVKHVWLTVERHA